MLRSRVAVLAVSGLLLAACGQVHPGSAAVVDGSSISMKRVQNSSVALCRYTLAQGSTTSVDNAQIRRSAVYSLVVQRLADQLASKRGITVGKQVVPAATTAQFDKVFGSKADLVLTEVKNSQRYSDILTALGKQSLGAKAKGASSDTVTTAGQQVLLAAAKRTHIEIDPRFGLSSIFTAKTSTGSLSVAVAAGKRASTSPLTKCKA